MPFSIQNLLQDEKSMNIGGLREKYKGKIPSGVAIKECVDFIIANKLESNIVDSNWYGDHRDNKIHFCLKINDGFEVFVSERNEKAWPEKFNTFYDAAFAKLDLLFNELGHAAPDSKINN